MTKQERERLVAHLRMTERWLMDEVSGLSAKQAAFRPSETAWSILDVLEHLTVAEPHYWKTLQESLKNPPPESPNEVNEAAILWYGIDRTQKARTAESRAPKGQYTDPTEALAAIRKLRTTMLEYAGSTAEGLRSHRYLNSKMDLYQWFVMISSHSQRHILQIREIKADPRFPNGLR